MSKSDDQKNSEHKWTLREKRMGIVSTSLIIALTTVTIFKECGNKGTLPLVTISAKDSSKIIAPSNSGAGTQITPVQIGTGTQVTQSGNGNTGIKNTANTFVKKEQKYDLLNPEIVVPNDNFITVGKIDSNVFFYYPYRNLGKNAAYNVKFQVHFMKAVHHFINEIDTSYNHQIDVIKVVLPQEQLVFKIPLKKDCYFDTLIFAIKHSYKDKNGHKFTPDVQYVYFAPGQFNQPLMILPDRVIEIVKNHSAMHHYSF